MNGNSSYALKRQGKHIPGFSGARDRRRCGRCNQRLPGSRGHGFVTPNGHGIECGGCAHVGGARYGA